MAHPLTQPSQRSPDEEQLALDAARPSSDFYELVLDSLSKHIAVLAGDGTIIATNAAWRQFSADNGGSEPHTGVGSNYLAVCDAAAEPPAAEVAAGLRALLRGDLVELTLDYPCHGPSEERWFALRASRFDEDGTPRLVVQHRNVTAHRDAEKMARLRSQLLNEAAAAVIGTDLEFRVTDWNRAAEDLYGWSRDEAIGQDVRELVVPEPSRGLSAEIDTQLVQAEGWTGDIALRRRDGTVFPAHLRNATVVDENGAAAGFVGVSIDLTERLRAEQELRSAQQYLAAVTGGMAEGLLTLDEHGRVVYMNPAAEVMLGWKLEHLAGRLLDRITHRTHPAGTRSAIEESPIARSWRDGETVRVDDDIFIRADGTALPVQYTAAPFETPDGVGGSAVVFGDITERNVERDRLACEVESLTWVTRVHEALAQDRFRLHAQPIIDLISGDVAQHELLIRMLDDTGQLIPPGVFLPAAERYGVVGEIDRWVVTQAAAIAAGGCEVEINLSAESIVDPEMAGFVERTLTLAGADPASVVIELTETAIMRDEEAGRTFLERIATFGCKIALDDFGTGYGGFTYLKHLPVDFLKIDIEFVRDLPRDELSQHVVRAVVQLAAGLGKKTVAEGVEDDETLALLTEYGVDFAQGYSIGRPTPVEETPGLQPPPMQRAGLDDEQQMADLDNTTGDREAAIPSPDKRKR